MIACSEYSDSKLLSLEGTLADARKLSEVLMDREISDFEVEILENPTSYEFSRALERFYMDSKLHDTAFVYCSCHGVKAVDGRLYLAAKNTETAFLGSTAVPATFLQDQITNCRSKQKVLVLDCCYAGALLRGSRHRAAATVPLSDAFAAGKGTVYIASSGATQYSWEGDTIEGAPEPSLFTQCLIEGLKTGEADLDGDGLVGVRELFDYVVDKLPERTPHQRPEFSSQEYVEIYLAKAPATAPAVQPEPRLGEPATEPSLPPVTTVVAAATEASLKSSPTQEVKIPPIVLGSATAPPVKTPPQETKPKTVVPPKVVPPLVSEKRTSPPGANNLSHFLRQWWVFLLFFALAALLVFFVVVMNIAAGSARSPGGNSSGFGQQ